MHSGVKETLCSHCGHLQVCSLKKKFIAAQQAVDNVCVSLGDHAMKDLRDFDWIKPVKLECIHFAAKQPTQRDISIAKELYEDSKTRRDVLLEGKFMEDPT